jgi:anoctamin-1
MNTILEMILPIFYKWWNSMHMRLKKKKDHSTKGKGRRWLKDLKLVEWGTRSLFPEYLEMGNVWL